MLFRLAHARLSRVAALLVVLLFVPGSAAHGYAAADMADTLASSAIGEAMPMPLSMPLSMSMSMSGDCAGCGGEGGDASVAACQTMCPGAFGVMPDAGMTRAHVRKPLDAFGGETARRGREGPPDPYPPKAVHSR